MDNLRFIVVLILLLLEAANPDEMTETTAAAAEDTENTTDKAVGKSLLGAFPVPANPVPYNPIPYNPIIPYNPCSPNPCQNGGTCSPSGGSYYCTCLSGYYGTNCEYVQQPVVPVACGVNPCMNNGICIPSGSSYTCQCRPPYSGLHCETTTPVYQPTFNQGACYPNPCMNGCQCVASCRHSSGYYCESQSGYLGKNCTIPPPTVRCDPNQIIVTVDDAFVREYDLGIGNSKLAIAQTADNVGRTGQACFASSNGISHTFSLTLPFTQCGTNVQTRAGTDQTVAINNIWLNRITNGGYDMPVPVICFECTYTREYSIITSLQPAVDQPPVIRQSGFVREQGVIGLCKVQACPAACPPTYSVTQGAVYTVGEIIHISIRSSSSAQGVVLLQTLFLSCDGSGSTSAAVVNLVGNGCPLYGTSNANVMPATVTHSGVSATVCASFQVPRLTGCATFYIHAQLQTCQGVCAVNCQNYGNYGRKRRSIFDNVKADVEDVYGPIYVLEGSDGIPRKILFPDKTLVNSNGMIMDIENHLNDTENHGNDKNVRNRYVKDSRTTTSRYLIVAAAVLCFIAFISIIYVLARLFGYSSLTTKVV